ncbi:MAG TPA: hypothetical protein VFS34_00630 [Thermoanaerobaculia bacterium]|nr:hypothetical protein [Thermoanaerobaculia bacterium]
MPTDTTDAATAPRAEPRVAAALLLLANVLFFWPVIFHGRVFSSHGAARAAFPWHADADDPRVRLLADPASAAAPVLRDLPAKMRWNRFAAGGTPGAINAVEGFLSPFAWAPALLLPEPAIETGILFLKLNAGFLFFFLFLRGRGLSDGAASCGAAAWGWSGAQSASWLWMQSSVTICFPLLLLWVDRSRIASRSDRAIAGAAGAFLLFLSGGYPFMIVYGAAAALAFATVEAWGRGLSEAGKTGRRLAAAVLLSAAVVFPAFRLSARLIRASGQVASRAGLARQLVLPPRHALLYAFPLAFGDPLRGDYRPLTGSRFETFLETAVGIGPIAFGLALLGAASSRDRRLYAYAAGLAGAAGAMVYVPPVRDLFSSLPVLSASLFERVKVLVVLGLAIAAGVGADTLGRALERRPALLRRAGALLPFFVGIPLILLAGRLYPAVLPGDAVFRATPGVRALESESEPGPSRFLATGWTLYPDLAQAFGLEDVRGHLFFEKDYRRLLAAADPGIYGRTGTLLVSDPRTLRPDSPVLDLLGVSAIAAEPGTALAGGALRRTYDGADLVVYRRLSAFPRFFLVSQWRPGGIDDVARADRETLRTTAFVEARELRRLAASAPGNGAEGSVAVEADGDGAFRLNVRTPSPALLVSSQKLFPPYWTARLDGARAATLRVDGMFFGLPVPAGSHRVEGRFRIPPGEAGVSATGAAVILALAAAGLRAGGRPA